MTNSSGVWQPPLAKLTIGLALGVVSTAFEALAIATVLPSTSAELGGLAWYGWTFSAFMLTNLVGITVGGNESDRRGLSGPFLVGTVLFVAGLVASGFAPTMPIIVAGRALQGFGAGLLSSVAYTAIARIYPVSLQPRMLATLSAAWVVPGLVAPALAGLLAAHLGWRWVFLGLTPFPVLACVLVLPTFRDLARDHRSVIDESKRVEPADSNEGTARNWRALRLAAGASVALGAASLDQHALAIVIGLLGAAVALHALSQLVPAGTLTARPGLPAAIATMGLLNFAFFGAEAFLPLTLSTVRHEPVMLSGLALSAASICWTAGAWVPVKLADRITRRSSVMMGLCVVGAGIVGLIALLSPQVPGWIAVVIWAVVGAGIGLAFTTTSAAILEAAPPGQEGAASTSLQLAQFLGAGVATGVGGAIVAAPFAGDPPRLGIAAVDVLMLLAVGVALVAARGVAEPRANAVRPHATNDVQVDQHPR